MDKETKKDRIKRHFAENKQTYLVGAGCLIVGAAGMKLTSQGAPDIVQTFTDSTDNLVTVINRSKNADVVIQYVKARNYIANPVRCIETGQEWPSQIEAAEAMDVAAGILSRHLNNKLPHANGLHFERV